MYGNSQKQSVNVDRDTPPLGDDVGRVLMFKISDGEIRVATIRDTDPRKGNNHKRGLPGGRNKNGESLMDTAFQEAREEAGASLDKEALYPVACISNTVPARDSNDRQIPGEYKKILNIVFAHYGEVELTETDDEDAEDPQWTSLENILHGDEDFFPSHVIFIFQSLRMIGEGFVAHSYGKISDKDDLLFFKKLAVVAAESRENYNIIEEMANFNLSKIIESAFSWMDLEKSEKMLSRYEFVPLGNEKYFVD